MAYESLEGLRGFRGVGSVGLGNEFREWEQAMAKTQAAASAGALAAKFAPAVLAPVVKRKTPIAKTPSGGIVSVIPRTPSVPQQMVASGNEEDPTAPPPAPSLDVVVEPPAGMSSDTKMAVAAGLAVAVVVTGFFLTRKGK